MAKTQTKRKSAAVKNDPMRRLRQENCGHSIVAKSFDTPGRITSALRSKAELLTYAWLLGIIDSYAAQAQFKDFHKGLTIPPGYWNPKPLERRAWLSTARNRLMKSYPAVALKLISYRLFVLNVVTYTDALPLMKRAGFGPAEAKLYCRLVACPDLQKSLISSLKALRAKDVKGDFCVDPDTLQKECGEDFQARKIPHMAYKQAHSKLRFIASSQNMSPSDLAHDLIERAAQYYYHARPLKSRLHAALYAKSAILGGVQQMIRHWTSPDRARLTQAADGAFSNKVISLSEATAATIDGSAGLEPEESAALLEAAE